MEGDEQRFGNWKLGCEKNVYSSVIKKFCFKT